MVLDKIILTLVMKTKYNSAPLSHTPRIGIHLVIVHRCIYLGVCKLIEYVRSPFVISVFEA